MPLTSKYLVFNNEYYGIKYFATSVAILSLQKVLYSKVYWNNTCRHAIYGDVVEINIIIIFISHAFLSQLLEN